MSEPATAAQIGAPAPIETAREAEKLIGHLIDVMDALLAMVEEETELVRAGRLDQVVAYEQTKTDLSRLYLADTQRIKTHQHKIAELTPARLDDLRAHHDEFRAVLQINLTVLATAHAVSESIIRGVSEELARKAQPQGYGVSGQAVTPGKTGAQPLTLSRVL
jgi:hypothetical protein